jgi:kynureninase
VQTARILAGAGNLPGLTIATPLPDADRGGFVALRTPRAQELSTKLREDGLFTDARGDILRLGPAPYVTDDELDEALALLRARLA